MVVPSSSPFFSWACFVKPQTSIQLPYTISCPSLLSNGVLKWRLLSVLQQADYNFSSGSARSFRYLDRFPQGVGSLVGNGRRLLEGTGILMAEAFDRIGGDKLGPEVANAKQKQNYLGPHAVDIAGEGNDTPQGGQRGLWSVVIPTYNRLPILSKCLQALEEQRDYSLGGVNDYEVIVVDDGSTDGTAEFLTNGNMSRAQYDDSEVGIGSGMCTQDERQHEVSSPSGGNSTYWNAREDSEPGRSRAHGEQEIDGWPQQSERFPHAKLVRQKHGGATKARNLGLKYAKGAIIVFIDSDLVVTESFFKAHGEALRDAFMEDGDDRAFTYGRVVNTSNFQDPKSEKFKITDHSAAFFATGNVAISRNRLLKAGKLLDSDADGPFDSAFSEYGWEDLELGVRLRQVGARIKHAPAAVGYHWHPAFSVEQLPKLIEQERQRGRNGVRFYRKHPTLDVQLMIQMTPLHELLWFLLTLGGLINEKSLEPILRRLVLAGRHRTAAALVSPILNWHTVQAVKNESRKLNLR